MGNCSSESGNTVVEVKPESKKTESKKTASKSSCNYKLSYFGLKGRAEFIRMLFAQADVEYEDCRVQFGEEWNNLKPKTPLGSLPILEVDGTVLVQSMAIGRFLAREFKLGGCNQLEMAQCDSLLETIAEIQAGIDPYRTENDAEKKAEMRPKVYDEKIKPKLCVIEKMLVANGGNCIVGKTISIADIAFYCTCGEYIRDVGLADGLTDFPKLEAHSKKVANEPRIAAWIAKRPNTPL